MKELEKDLEVNINNKPVKLSKLPCWKCEYRYSYVCPVCDWNKDGKYNTYISFEDSLKLESEKTDDSRKI